MKKRPRYHGDRQGEQGEQGVSVHSVFLRKKIPIRSSKNNPNSINRRGYRLIDSQVVSITCWTRSSEYNNKPL